MMVPDKEPSMPCLSVGHSSITSSGATPSLTITRIWSPVRCSHESTVHTQTINQVSGSQNSKDVLTLELDVARKWRQLTRTERPVLLDVRRGRRPVSRK